MIFKTKPLAVSHKISIPFLIDMGDELNITRVFFSTDIGFYFSE